MWALSLSLWATQPSPPPALKSPKVIQSFGCARSFSCNQRSYPLDAPHRLDASGLSPYISDTEGLSRYATRKSGFLPGAILGTVGLVLMLTPQALPQHTPTTLLLEQGGLVLLLGSALTSFQVYANNEKELQLIQGNHPELLLPP